MTVTTYPKMPVVNIDDVYTEADGKIAIDFGGEEVLLTQEEATHLYIDPWLCSTGTRRQL